MVTTPTLFHMLTSSRGDTISLKSGDARTAHLPCQVNQGPNPCAQMLLGAPGTQAEERLLCPWMSRSPVRHRWRTTSTKGA